MYFSLLIWKHSMYNVLSHCRKSFEFNTSRIKRGLLKTTDVKNYVNMQNMQNMRKSLHFLLIESVCCQTQWILFQKLQMQKFHTGTLKTLMLVASKPLSNGNHVSSTQYAKYDLNMTNMHNTDRAAPPARSLYTTMGPGGSCASASRMTASMEVVFPPERRINEAKSN